MLALVDNRIPQSSSQKLSDLGFELVALPCADYLSSPVCCHPDMILFIGWDKLFCHSRYYEENGAVIDKICHAGKLSLILSDEPTGEKYPLDTLFNCVILGDHLLCNKRTVSRHVLDAAYERGLAVLHTNQGYTKCSVCKVDENAIITSDPSVERVCTAAGIDVLKISEIGVSLSGYDRGFIGGATGADKGNVYFCGSIVSHPDGERIKDFCQAHGKTAFSLSDEPLYDIGSIIFI